MREKSTENHKEPILNVVGDLVALGPLRRDLLPLYQRWINDLGLPVGDGTPSSLSSSLIAHRLLCSTPAN